MPRLNHFLQRQNQTLLIPHPLATKAKDMKRLSILILVGLMGISAIAQTLPADRAVDWTVAGLRDTTTVGFVAIDLAAEGIVGDGSTNNDAAFAAVLSGLSGSGAILRFPAGQFRFETGMNLPDNVVLKGEGAESTTLQFDLGGVSNAIQVSGSDVNSETSPVTLAANKGASSIEVADATVFSTGDWIRIKQDDEALMTSTWAYNTYGQIVRIASKSGNQLQLESALRLDLDLAAAPYIVRMEPAKNVGIECLKIHRLDDTAPAQTSSINFIRAVNCWIKGVESENCTYSHFEANYSSNLSISKSYAHHGFDYGGGGRAYGVMLHFTTGECLIEDNTFEHLRHSLIVQAGANGNVFAYNYSFDPYWDTFPNDSAGDMVLHGNYPFANLFEQNVCRNIVIDNSHGPNGPHNTFLRNRSEGYGIFFSADNSPDQNFLGNEITNNAFPYSLVNYSINGTGHFIYGNNNKGSIDPAGTENLPDLSYAFTQAPAYVPSDQWAGIGTTNPVGQNSIPARDRFLSGDFFANACSEELGPQLVIAKTWLQAAFVGSEMRTELQAQSLLELQQPFNTAPWNYTGTEQVTSLPTGITDWVLLELRPADDLVTEGERHAAFLSKDGSILDLAGNEGVVFSSLENGRDYHLIIRSRNHLDLLTEFALSFPMTNAYDFSVPANVRGGTSQLADLGNGSYGQIAGDMNADGAMTFVDYNSYLANSSAILDYEAADINLDGHVTVLDFNWYRINASALGISEVRY